MDSIDTSAADDTALREPCSGAEGRAQRDSDVLSWRVAPAVLSLGVWLLRVSPDAPARVFAPPGVALVPGAETHASNTWRVGVWSEPGRFDAGLAPDSVQTYSSVGDVLAQLPTEYRDWVLEATVRHIRALERGARLRADDPREEARARAEALASRAAIERADMDAVTKRLAHDSLLQAELAQLVEAALTARDIADGLVESEIGSTDLLDARDKMEQLSEQVISTTAALQTARDVLARELAVTRLESREYRIAMASRSWRLTRPFRRAAILAREIQMFAARVTSRPAEAQTAQA